MMGKMLSSDAPAHGSLCRRRNVGDVPAAGTAFRTPQNSAALQCSRQAPGRRGRFIPESIFTREAADHIVSGLFTLARDHPTSTKL
jgi:hypothetical protein